jgi:hypothetical protein
MGFRSLYIDSSAGTAVNPAVAAGAQVIKFTTLPASDDEQILVGVTFVITEVATPVANTIPLQIAIGGQVYGNNFVTSAAVSNPSVNYITLWFPATSRMGDLITAQIGGGLTLDTHTSINVVQFMVFAISGLPGGT